MNADLKRLAQNLEAAFFVPDDPRLVESLRELHTLDLTSGLWAEVSGIRNPRVLALWEQLAVPTAIVAALAVVPFTLAIWADEQVEDIERREVLGTFKDTFFFGTIVKDILNAWLERSPGEDLFQAWAAFIGALTREVSPLDRQVLADEVLWAARELSHRGPEEKAVFERLAKAFRP